MSQQGLPWQIGVSPHACRKRWREINDCNLRTSKEAVLTAYRFVSKSPGNRRRRLAEREDGG